MSEDVAREVIYVARLEMERLPESTEKFVERQLGEIPRLLTAPAASRAAVLLSLLKRGVRAQKPAARCFACTMWALATIAATVVLFAAFSSADMTRHTAAEYVAIRGHDRVAAVR
jgi:hypothetical protein